MPWVYCGTLTVILAPLYFLLPNKVVTAREKICGGLMLSLFVFSFNLTPVDMVWHGFQAPNWLNHRYSFMFCFFLLVFGYRTLDALLDGRLSKKAPIIAGGILLLWSLYTEIRIRVLRRKGCLELHRLHRPLSLCAGYSALCRA